ncbi:MAG: sulfotransferase family protein [Acidimicrobiia bacterium]
MRTMGRYFLVACPRSGTTLLQSMLANHPEVFSLPETHFFVKIWGRLRHLSALRIVSPRAAHRTLGQLTGMVQPGLASGLQVPPYWPLFGRYGRAFWQLLDSAALTSDKRLWLEKSPPHLHRMADIERAVPGARFIHLMRDGRDVVASLYDLCLRSPELWLPQVLPGWSPNGVPEEQRRATILLGAVDRWNGDLGISIRRVGDPRHTHVVFENLLEHPVEQLTELCRFMEVSFEEAMLRHWEAAERVVGWRAVHPHMHLAFEPMQETRLQKFHALLTVEQQELVASLLLSGGDPRSALAGHSS